MDDDDPTPTRRPRSHWDAEQRAHVGREHRGELSTASERRRSRASGATAAIADSIERELGPVPEEFGGREITEPWEILDRQELSPEELRIVQRTKRNGKDPLLVEDGAKFLLRALRKELDDRSAEKRRANEILAVMDTSPNGKLALEVAALRGEATAAKSTALKLADELGVRHSKTRGTVHENLAEIIGASRLARILVIAALGGAGGSVTYVATALRTSGADAQRLERAERDIEQMQSDLRDLRRVITIRKDSP